MAVALSEVALQNSQNPQVQAFAQKIKQRHPWIFQGDSHRRAIYSQ